MRSSAVALTYEGIETLMRNVADRLRDHREVAPILALNHVMATPADIHDALRDADVRIDTCRGITIRPTGAGRHILVPISKLVADAIDDELGESVTFTMRL